MMTSESGMTTASRFIARSWFSNWPPHSKW